MQIDRGSPRRKRWRYTITSEKASCEDALRQVTETVAMCIQECDNPHQISSRAAHNKNFVAPAYLTTLAAKRLIIDNLLPDIPMHAILIVISALLP